MPGLTPAEHQAALREARTLRNAGRRYGRASLARAHEWIAALDARVETLVTPTGVLYTVSVPGFHSQTAWRLADAVTILDAHIIEWCGGPATNGPTGAKLAPLCAKRRRLPEGWTVLRGGGGQTGGGDGDGD